MDPESAAPPAYDDIEQGPYSRYLAALSPVMTISFQTGKKDAPRRSSIRPQAPSPFPIE